MKCVEIWYYPTSNFQLTADFIPTIIDTADLDMRMGLHSGATTAGVLRGDRARYVSGGFVAGINSHDSAHHQSNIYLLTPYSFQLFGDTMNTASRMESTGVNGQIQVTHATAELLRAAGKDAWLSKREEGVFAKGKGQMETFFVTVKSTRRASDASGTSNSMGSSLSDTSSQQDNANDVDDMPRAISGKMSRLIAWNTEIMLGFIKQIIARRNAYGNIYTDDAELTEKQKQDLYSGEREFGAVKETIYLPQAQVELVGEMQDPKDVKVSELVVGELLEFVTRIAEMYNDNPFHNFEHAAHVTMSVTKLLSRIVAPGVDDKTNFNSYGITTDPLTQLAVTFAAIIHDAAHVVSFPFFTITF